MQWKECKIVFLYRTHLWIFYLGGLASAIYSQNRQLVFVEGNTKREREEENMDVLVVALGGR